MFVVLEGSDVVGIIRRNVIPSVCPPPPDTQYTQLFTISNFITVLTLFCHLQLDLFSKLSFYCSLLHFVCDRLIYFLSLHFAPFYWSVMCGQTRTWFSSSAS